MHFPGISTKEAICQNHLAKHNIGYRTTRKVSRWRNAIMGLPGPHACHYDALHPLCGTWLHPSLTNLQLAHPLISDTHVSWTWGEEVEEGEWESNSRFGSARELQSKKIDESSRRQWEGLLRVETGSIYIPTLCLPGQFWLSVLPCHAGVPSVWNVLVTGNIHVVLQDPAQNSPEFSTFIDPCVYLPYCFYISFKTCVYVFI